VYSLKFVFLCTFSWTGFYGAK